METSPESNGKEKKDGVVPENIENIELDERVSREQNPSNEERENGKDFHEEVITLQVDPSKYQQGDLAHNEKIPSDKEVVGSLHSSLKSTPHSVVNKASSDEIKNKGSGWKVWLPILCVVTIFFLVVIVVSVKNSHPESETGKYTLNFIRQCHVMNIYQSYILNTNCFVMILFTNETLI